MALSRHDIENRFMHHPPDEGQVQQHEQARNVVKAAAHKLNALLPDNAERDRAIDSLDAGLMWANAAIARRR